ncbi:hypothetical protein T4B_6564 [Trichinella pseudospiralis]|uniref:Uncharacterized protein n=1 Tax=Trichinella pseudospiralis TaxID=6337 RepID=A0A0V1GP94_TRIPS|nr:hypothetical protein T4B_6564 [Trichinella pseudospiralis]
MVFRGSTTLVNSGRKIVVNRGWDILAVGKSS